MLKKIESRIVNIHIPKTAGSSFRAQMARHTKIIGIDHDGSPGDFFQIMREMARSRLDDLRQGGMQFMSGHYRFRDIRAVLDGFDQKVSLVTTVRDPIHRVLSDYFYSSSEKHNAQAAFVSEFPTLGKYLSNTAYIKTQFNALAPSENASVDETFDNLMENFDFVGVTEHFDEHIKLFLNVFGLDAQDNIRQNVGPRRGEIGQVYDQYKDQISDIIGDDITLYNRIKHEWGLL